MSGAFPAVPARELPAYAAAAARASDDDPRSVAFQMEALEGAAAGEDDRYRPRGDTLAKNRYLDIMPSRTHRVRIARGGSAADRARLAEPDGDYINACWVRPAAVVPGGEAAERDYIAAQAPVEAVLDDWWLMVWEQNVRVVLMLTRLVEKGTLKANQYWPRLRQTARYGDVDVTLTDRRALENETVRSLLLKRGGETRAVTLIQYTTWPDHGVPGNIPDVVRFLEIYRAEREKAPAGSPVLLHCSAGIGRTGTFAAIDIGLDMLRKNPARGVSVFDTVIAIRRCRPGAVQTLAQYSFIFEVLSHAVTHGCFGLGAP